MEQYLHDVVMDLARRRRPSDRYVIHVRSKNEPADPDHTPRPRYLGSGPAGVKYYWDGSPANRSSSANHSALHADGDFPSKSRVLVDMLSHPVRHHSFTTVLLIAGIFLFLTVTITVAVVVFCRKRNAVFALQKSEQSDVDDDDDDDAGAGGDYELDELNTDVEFTETDADSEYDNISRRRSYPADGGEDPTHRLLAAPRDPFHGCRCRERRDGGAAYRTMVVAAVLERPAADGRCARRPDDTDVDSDHELLYSARCHLMSHSGSCPCDENVCAYCRSANTNNHNNNDDDDDDDGIGSSGTGYVPVASGVRRCTGNVVLQSSLVEGAYDNLWDISDRCRHCTHDCTPSFLYVALPPETDRPKSNKGRRYYVRLPPKRHDDDADDGIVQNDADSENDYDIGVNCTGLSSNSGSCVIDLHPEDGVRRPNSLRDWSNVGDVRMSRASVRSKSVTEDLSGCAKLPSSPDCSLRSCPDTPLMEPQSGSSASEANLAGAGHDLAPSSGSLPYHYSTNKHTVSSVKYSDSMLYNETSGDQTPGFSFILSSPYSSFVSLTPIPISESDGRPPSPTYAHLPNSATSLGQPTDGCSSQTIRAGPRHEGVPHPSSQSRTAAENGELGRDERTSANRNQAGTSRDECSDVTGQEEASASSDEENEETHLNGSGL